nr:MAG TPA: hypothetical protein [Caudoviricetes sp.]
MYVNSCTLMHNLVSLLYLSIRFVLLFLRLMRLFIYTHRQTVLMYIQSRVDTTLALLTMSFSHS